MHLSKDSAKAFLRQHALFLVLVAVGAGLRVVTSLAYRPALLIDDSQGYLGNAHHLVPDALHPIAYPVFLRVIGAREWLAIVPAAQHAIGLGIAILIYALLNRLGVRRWISALAAAPVLLDAYQLDMEQFVLAETLFELLLVSGCAALLWNRRPGPLSAVLAGLAFAAVALTRPNGAIAMAPALLVVLALRYEKPTAGSRRWARGVRPGLPAAAALIAAFALPVAGYAVWFHHRHGSYALTSFGGRFLYGRVTPFADCSKLTLPDRTRLLCPTRPVGDRPTLAGSTAEYYMWGWDSPVWRLGEQERNRRAGDLAKQVIRHQPLDYARAVGHDFLRGFALTRTTHPGELWISRWHFPLTYPIYLKNQLQIIRAHGGGSPHVDRGLARFLRGYQRFVFTPGPLLAVGLLAGLLAGLGVGRLRRSALRWPCFMFAATGALVFASAVASNQFSWRYQLPLIVLLAPAAALGLSALARRPGALAPVPATRPAPEPAASLVPVPDAPSS